MPPTIQVRPAGELDLPAVQAIYANHVQHGTATFELEPPDLAEMQQRFQILRHGGFPYLVAEVEGRVVGYGYAGPYRARPAYRFTVEDSIYLHRDYVGRGVGRALLEPLISTSAERGFKQMIAVIGDSANTRSIRLHERSGFALIGTFRAVGFKFNRWLDTVLMQRAL